MRQPTYYDSPPTIQYFTHRLSASASSRVHLRQPLPGRPPLGDSRELLRDRAPPVIKAHRLVLLPIGAVAVQDVRDVLRAQRVVPHGDDRGHERVLGGPPSADQRIREDNALEVIDGQEAAGDVQVEIATVLADFGD